MATIIKPTTGRVVWFYESDVTSAHAALVACVLNDSLVNLMVVDFDGTTSGQLSVPLVQEGETRPSGPHCMWMPYQVGQAAKTAAVMEGKTCV